MFVYIADFEQLSLNYKTDLVKLMDMIFKKLDTLSIKHGV